MTSKRSSTRYPEICEYCCPGNLCLTTLFQRRLNERERNALIMERDQQRNTLHALETDLHQMQLHENTLENQIREKKVLEEQVEVMKEELTTFTSKFKVV